MLRLLLTNRLRGMLNTVLKSDPKKRNRKRFALLGYLLVPSLLTVSILEMFKELLHASPQGLAVIHLLLNTSLAALLIFLVFSGLTVALHFFFLSKDHALLRAAPLSNATLYLFKYIESLFANSSIFWAFGLPLLLAYGLVIKAPVFYYLIGVPAALCFLAFPTGLAGLLSIGLARLIPAKRAKNIAVLIVGVIFISAWAAFQFLRVSRFDPASKHFNPHSLDHLARMDRHFSWLPSEWLSQTLQNSGRGDPQAALFPFLLLLAGSALLYALGAVLMHSYLQHTPSPVKSRLPEHRKIRRDPAYFTQALVMREFWILTRDSRQSTQLLMFLVIILVFPFIVQQNMQGMNDMMKQYLPFIYPLLLSTLFSATTAARLIPLEGRSFPLIKCGPRPLSRIVLIKNLLAMLLAGPAGFAALLITSQLNQISGVRTVQALGVLAALCAGAAGVGAMFGAHFGKFDWENPKRMLSGAGNLLLTFIILFIFLTFCGLIFICILVDLLAVGLLVVSALSLLMLWAGTILAAAKLDSMDWCF